MTVDSGYKLRVPDDTAQLLKKLHPEIKKHIKYALKLIIDDPFYGKALKDDLEGIRSFRVKRYRVIYRLATDKKHIEIVTVGPRKIIYEETFKIISKQDKP